MLRKFRSLSHPLALAFAVAILTAFTASNFKLISSLPLSGGSFTTDNLGSIYLVKKNVLEKYDRNGKLQNSFSDKKLGELSSVDASNPLKVLVYSKGFSSIVLLDNTLTQNGEAIRLDQAGFPFATLACTSHDNGYWIYDSQNTELVRMGKDLAITHRSGNISQALGYRPDPEQLMEHNNLVYLNDIKNGILVFDTYGTYYKTIPLSGLKSFQVDGPVIFYFSKGRMVSYNTKLLNESVTPLPDSTASAARAENERLYLLKQDTLRVYSVK